MSGGGVANYAPILQAPPGSIVSDDTYKTWMCIICGWIYEEEKGAPGEGLPPGTRWEDVPEFWTCPDCGAAKEDFDMVQL